MADKKGIDMNDKIPSLVELFEDKFPRVARSSISWGKP